MPTAWFLCPYKLKRLHNLPARYVAMDDLTPEIRAVGGEWAEAEIDNNRAIVRVRATDAVLRSIALLHPRLSDTEAASAWTSTRKAPQYDSALDAITFRASVLSPCRPLDSLVSTVRETPPSGEVISLLAAWLGVGFGLGFRIPYDIAFWLADHGVYPDAWAKVLAKIFFDQAGAFPTNATVIDAFNRADESPVSDGGNWTNPLVSGDSNLRVLTNQLARAATGPVSWGSAYRSNVTYGPDTEVYGALPTLPLDGEGIELFLRAQSPGTTGLDGYFLHLQKVAGGGNDTYGIWRVDNNAQTQLGANATQEVAAGDSIGIEAIGSAIAGYYKASGGSWAQVLTRTDATHGAAGNIGVLGQLTTWRLDDLSGGTVVAGGVDKAVSDSGAGVEALALNAAVNLSDAGSGLESLALVVDLPVADAVAGADIISLVANVTVLESGAGAEGVILAVEVPITEVGSGLDTLSLLAALAVAESGAGSESLSAVETNQVSVSDAGAGSEGLSAIAAVNLTDVAIGAESLTISVLISILESGVGIESLLVDTGLLAQIIRMAAVALAVPKLSAVALALPGLSGVSLALPKLSTVALII